MLSAASRDYRAAERREAQALHRSGGELRSQALSEKPKPIVARHVHAEADLHFVEVAESHPDRFVVWKQLQKLDCEFLGTSRSRPAHLEEPGAPLLRRAARTAAVTPAMRTGWCTSQQGRDGGRVEILPVHTRADARLLDEAAYPTDRIRSVAQFVPVYSQWRVRARDARRRARLSLRHTTRVRKIVTHRQTKSRLGRLSY
jgi:hypothetical protein